MCIMNLYGNFFLVEPCMLSIMLVHIIAFCVNGFSAAWWAHNLYLHIRYELYTWHYYKGVVDGGFARDNATKGVVDGGYFVYSRGTICDFDRTFSSR